MQLNTILEIKITFVPDLKNNTNSKKNAIST